MLRLAILLGLASTTLAVLPFKLTDCATSANKLATVANIKLSNVDPIRIPGNETLSLDVQILQPISGMHYKVELTVLKHLLFGYVIVPCFEDPSKNTCEFELCDVLSGAHYATDPHHCPIELATSSPDLQCSCPFSPGTYSIKPTTVVMDQLPSYLAFLAQGDYKANLKITDRNTNEVVSCFTLEASTAAGAAGCTGISCLIGRK